jgi:hypothetical protein
MKKLITSALLGGAIVGSLLGAGTASATTSYLVPSQLTPGTYRMTSSSPYGAYAEICTDYTCSFSTGMIKNYFVDSGESAIVVIPSSAVMVNGDDAVFTKVA